MTGLVRLDATPLRPYQELEFWISEVERVCDLQNRTVSGSKAMTPSVRLVMQQFHYQVDVWRRFLENLPKLPDHYSEMVSRMMTEAQVPVAVITNGLSMIKVHLGYRLKPLIEKMPDLDAKTPPQLVELAYSFELCDRCGAGCVYRTRFGESWLYFCRFHGTIYKHKHKIELEPLRQPEPLAAGQVAA